MSVALLLDSAVRSLLLGACVGLLLHLLRLRDTRAENTIWIAVLVAGLAMPLLVLMLPGGLALPLPAFSWPHIAAPAPAAPVLGIALVSGDAPSVMMAYGPPAWLGPWHWHAVVLLVYGAVTLSILARLATGLILTARLYAQAAPIDAPWAQGKQIRASAAVSGPISFGRSILLPDSYVTWPPAKLSAVLAHEQSHVGRGDFFILLLAALYRALFWFSPFAWWLQARLSALAESASDQAAIAVLNDRTSYAEILLEVARNMRRTDALVAMAKGPDIHWRMDRILDETPVRSLSLRVQLAAAAAILPASCLIAAAHAAVPPTAPHGLPMLVLHQAPYVPFAVAASEPRVLSQSRAAASAAANTSHSVPRPRPRRDADEITYNPRALLADPDVAVVRAVLPLSGN